MYLDPNDDSNREAVKAWIALADFYQVGHPPRPQTPHRLTYYDALTDTC